MLEGLLVLRGQLLDAVQWNQTVLTVPTREQETAMNRTASRQTVPSTHRTRRPSLSPYYMDETAFTLADIRRDRALGTSPVKR